MSFNIRFSKAGPQRSGERKQLGRREISAPRAGHSCDSRKTRPTCSACRKRASCRSEDLKKALPEYAFYGVGRDDGKQEGEFSGIFYRKCRFTKNDAGSFWLSETPEKPGTSFYLAPNKHGGSRVASWVKL